MVQADTFFSLSKHSCTDYNCAIPLTDLLMITLTYTISIHAPAAHVYDALTDKASYSQWASAWGEGMTYTGEWAEGQDIVFHDQSHVGTKAHIELIQPNHSIKLRHIGMVDLSGSATDDNTVGMEKWIGSREEYILTENDNQQTTIEVMMVTDEDFGEMFDSAWPLALQILKDICES